MTPDAKLVEASLGGNREAFAALADRHTGRVFATALAVLRNEEDARDVAQESFLRAFRSLATLDEPERFGPWIRGIAAHAARDIRRRRHVEKDAIEEIIRRRMDAHATVLEAARAHAPVVAKKLDDGGLEPEIERRLLQYLEALPEQAQLALRLRFEQGLSYKEIALEMAMPVSTVRGILHRATGTLRDRLRPHVDPGRPQGAPKKRHPSKRMRRPSGQRPAATLGSEKPPTESGSDRKEKDK